MTAHGHETEALAPYLRPMKTAYVIGILGYTAGMSLSVLGHALVGLLILCLDLIGMVALLYAQRDPDAGEGEPDHHDKAPIHL